MSGFWWVKCWKPRSWKAKWPLGYSRSCRSQQAVIPLQEQLNEALRKVDFTGKAVSNPAQLHLDFQESGRASEVMSTLPLGIISPICPSQVQLQVVSRLLPPFSVEKAPPHPPFLFSWGPKQSSRPHLWPAAYQCSFLLMQERQERSGDGSREPRYRIQTALIPETYFKDDF